MSDIDEYILVQKNMRPCGYLCKDRSTKEIWLANSTRREIKQYLIQRAVWPYGMVGVAPPRTLGGRKPRLVCQVLSLTDALGNVGQYGSAATYGIIHVIRWYRWSA